MKLRNLLFFLIGFGLFMIAEASGKTMGIPLMENKIKELRQQELPVYLHAQRLEYQKMQNRYIGSGYVDIRYGDIRLQADELTLDANTGQVKATGNVILDEGQNRLVGEQLEMNLKTKLGSLQQGEAFFAPSYFLTGQKIERLAEDKFLIIEGSYTTCDQTIPDWKFKVRRCLVHLNNYAYLTDFSLYMKKVPVFRFPYAMVPIKKDRTTGLLIPGLGYSDKDGFIIKDSFFWAISQWTDATLLAEYFSKRGIGGGLEFRYALTPDDKGKVQSYLIWDRIDKAERWKTEMEVKQELGCGVKGILKADLLSDRTYDQQFAEEIGQRRRQEQDSYLWLYKNWDYYGASGIAEYTEDLYQTDNNRRWRLPEVKIFAVSQPLFDSPVFYKLEISGLNWNRKTMDEKEEENQRLHINPQLSLPWEVWPRTVITPRAGYLQTWYTKNQQGQSDQRGLYEVGLNLSGPQYYRIWEKKTGSLQKIKHLIQPFIDYSYIPDEDQSDLLSFDMLDNIAGENILRYGLIQHFLGGFAQAEEGEDVREILLLTLSQEYDIAEARRTKDTNQKPHRPFSPLKLDAEIKPGQDLRLDWEIGYNFYEQKVESTNLDLWVSLSKKVSLTAGWRYTNIIKEEPESDDQDINFLAAGTEISLTKSLGLGVSGKYNLKSEQWVEDKYSVNFVSQCWGIGLSYVDRFDEDEFNFELNLLGLSSVGI